MQKKWLYPLGFVLLGFTIFYLYQKYKVAPDIKLEQLAVQNLEGESVELNSYQGKKTVLCFAASWCGPCRNELKMISAYKEELYKDVEFIVISDETFSEINSFKEQISYPFVWLKLMNNLSAIGIFSIPTTYFVNTKGVVVKKTVGYIDWRDPSTAKHLNKVLD